MTGFSPKTRQIVLGRADNLCEICCRGGPLQCHHRRARGMGSSKDPLTNTPANALAICPADHAWVESHRTEALENGWLVRQGKNPEHVPVLYRRTHFVILSADGSITYM